jgi:hypothetical protein
MRRPGLVRVRNFAHIGAPGPLRGYRRGDPAPPANEVAVGYEFQTCYPRTM